MQHIRCKIIIDTKIVRRGRQCTILHLSEIAIQIEKIFFLLILEK